jgi:hypothetical protein
MYFRQRPTGSLQPFGLGIALSEPLQIGIRFFRTPLPPRHSSFLAVRLLYNVSDLECRKGLPRFARMTIDWQGSIFTPAGYCHHDFDTVNQSPPAYHFGYGVSASFAD